MKKLLFSILLAVGFLTISQAQTLIYTVENQTVIPWDFKIGDGNGNGNYHPPFTNTVNGSFANFGFNLQFGGSNSFGCNAYEQVTSAPSFGPINFPCWVPQVWNYSFVQINPFIYWLYVEIS